MVAAPVDISVVTSGHDVADARLHREVAALIKHGMSVEVLGLGAPQDGPPGACVRTWPRRGPLGRATLAATIAMRARGRVVITLDPDSAVAAGTAILASGRMLVVDVHEDFARVLADRPWTSSYKGLTGRAAHGLVTAFNSLAQRAALTVVADEHVPPLTARHRIVVRNEPDPSMLPEPGERGEIPRALYVGDVRASRGLFAMLGALRYAPDWHLDLVGPVAPADQARLTAELADHPDVMSRIHLHGRRPPTQSWLLASQAWCGLSLLADTPAFREAIPTKVHEYLACGLAVVTTDLARPAALVRDAGAGAVVPAWTPSGQPGSSGSPSSSASSAGEEQTAKAVGEQLVAWSTDPSAIDAARAAARAVAAEAARAHTAYDDFAIAVSELL